MFDCCRIPGQEKLDWSVSYAKPGDDGTSGHIVVFRKGRVYKLEPWQDGRLLSVSEIEEYVPYSSRANAFIDDTSQAAQIHQGRDYERIPTSERVGFR